jgi:DNA repair protein RecO (recombination protein O)
MLRRTEGIVLRSRPFGEADLIVEYLTKDFGVQPALAKSPRKIRSRFGGSLEPFTHARVSFLGREEARLPRLTQSDIVRPFQRLREDLRCFLRASELAELAMKLMPEREPNPGAFDLVLWALDALENDCAQPIVPLVFRARLLALAGYAPSIKGCLKCRKGATRFYPADGALFCEAHKKGERSMELSAGLLKAYGDLCEWPLEKVMRIRPSEGLMKEIGGFLDAHIREHVAVTLKSEKFGKET